MRESFSLKPALFSAKQTPEKSKRQEPMPPIYFSKKQTGCLFWTWLKQQLREEMMNKTEAQLLLQTQPKPATSTSWGLHSRDLVVASWPVQPSAFSTSKRHISPAAQLQASQDHWLPQAPRELPDHPVLRQKSATKNRDIPAPVSFHSNHSSLPVTPSPRSPSPTQSSLSVRCPALFCRCFTESKI